MLLLMGATRFPIKGQGCTISRRYETGFFHGLELESVRIDDLKNIKRFLLADGLIFLTLFRLAMFLG